MTGWRRYCRAKMRARAHDHMRETFVAEISLFRGIGGDAYELLKSLALEHPNPFADYRAASRRGGAPERQIRGPGGHDARSEDAERQDRRACAEEGADRRGQR